VCAAAVINGETYQNLRAMVSVVASGTYKADIDSECGNADDIVVYTGVCEKAEGGVIKAMHVSVAA
jgi:hypothetical protein